MDFSKQGKITPGLISKILVTIHVEKFTGTLGLTKGSVKKVISFSAGKPVSARSNVLKESLGGILVERGSISSADLDAIVKETKSSENLRMGEVLIKKKILTSAQLEELLKEQIMIRLTEPMSWSEGDYKLVEGKLAQQEQVSLDEGIPEIVYRAYALNAGGNALNSSISEQSIPIRAKGWGIKLEEIRMSGKELGIFRLINGKSTISEIMRASRADERLVLGFLNALEQLGLIELKSQVTTSAIPVQDPEASQKGLSEKSLKLYKDIGQKLSQVQGKNYFEYFGADKNASAEEIKMAYFAFAKNFHPDRFPKDFSTEMREKGEELFSKLTDAFNTLTNTRKKAEYMDKLDLKEKGVSQAPAQIMESEIEFQKGQILLKKADFDGAIEQFKRAIALYPDEAEYYVHLGMALFRKGTRKKDSSLLASAKREIDNGIKKNSSLDRAYLYMGHIYKHEENMQQAKSYYQKALDANPNCLEASSEIRLMASRGSKAK